MTWEAELQILGVVALAMLLGGIIGAEREAASKPAGFRTHMLVAGASALLMSLGRSLIGWFDDPDMGDHVRTDPIRLVEAVVTGVGFLGAGTIFKHGAQKVEGLTTAAALLLVAVVSVAVAIYEFVLAIGITALTLIVLRILGRFNSQIASNNGEEDAKKENFGEEP